MLKKSILSLCLLSLVACTSDDVLNISKAIISSTEKNKSSEPVKSKNLPVKSIQVTSNTLVMIEGSKLKPTATVTYEDNSVDSNIIWSSSNNTIATINHATGEISAIREGTVTITGVSQSDISKTVSIVVIIRQANNSVIPSENYYPSVVPSGNSYNPIIPSQVPNVFNPGDTSKATVDGKVFDRDGYPIDGVDVTLTLLDEGVTFTGGEKSVSMKTITGAYVFRNVPIGARIELKASRDGWTNQSRVESVKSNLQGDTSINKFNFGAEGVKNSIYCIQDEPQVASVKVNGLLLDNFGYTYSGNNPSSSFTPAVSGLKPDLIFKLTFTEPVKQSSVQNNFKVYSENASTGRVDTKFNLSDVQFDWTWASDSKSVTLKSKKALLQAKSGDQMRYKVMFDKAFEDNQGVNAYDGAFFKFGANIENDYFTLALENDTVEPVLSSISYNDTGLEDQLVLNFSESMDVYNRRSAKVLNATSYEIWVERNDSNHKSVKRKLVTPSNIELSTDGKSVKLKFAGYGAASNTNFYKDDIISVKIADTNFTDPAGRSFSTSNVDTSEGIDVNDSKKIIKVTNKIDQ